MTQAEFSKGWKLLILQPWGWRYRSMTEQGAMTEETKTQLQFYYEKLKWAHPDAWLKVAELYAEGQEWPSVRDLRTALQTMNSRFVTGITDGRREQFEPMPKGLLDRIGKLGKSISGA